MAYEHFIPEVWAEGIERELEKNMVYAEDCNRQYEGKATKQGQTVHILGVGKPSIKTLAYENRSGEIEAAEEVEDTSAILTIDQIRYFNYKVGDIDRAQGTGGIMDALSKETSEGLADEVDRHIAALVKDSNVPVCEKTSDALTNSNILGFLDAALEKLYEKNVRPNSKIVAVVSPRVFTLFRQAYQSKDTNNSNILKNGYMDRYNNLIIKMSNNVPRSRTSADGDTDNIMIRTQRAIAFAQTMTHTEAYRPENGFSDAVKGFILFGAKVIRPKEMVNLTVRF